MVCVLRVCVCVLCGCRESISSGDGEHGPLHVDAVVVVESKRRSLRLCDTLLLVVTLEARRGVCVCVLVAVAQAWARRLACSEAAMSLRRRGRSYTHTHMPALYHPPGHQRRRRGCPVASRVWCALMPPSASSLSFDNGSLILTLARPHRLHSGLARGKVGRAHCSCDGRRPTRLPSGARPPPCHPLHRRFLSSSSQKAHPPPHCNGRSTWREAGWTRYARGRCSSPRRAPFSPQSRRWMVRCRRPAPRGAEPH